MSEPEAVPLPREGEVFFDVRGEARTMRLSWYADSSVAVFSIWQANRCTGTFRLPFVDLVRMVETLQSGPPSRTADAVSRHSADPSFTSAVPDRGYDYGYGEATSYLPAATYGHQPGYESGRGYESGHDYESGHGYEPGRRYEPERGYEPEPIYAAGPAYRSARDYGASPDYPDHPPPDASGPAGGGAGHAYGPPGYGPPDYRGIQSQRPGGPGSHQVSGPYQGYADQAGYPKPAGYQANAEYAEPAGYPDYRASHQGQGRIGPAHRVTPGAAAHEARPIASASQAEWMAAPSYSPDTSMLDFPSAPATADLETSDWDAATASYQAP